MTSEAPKEIYAWVYDQWKTAWNVDPEESDASASRYTLTTHALAMVAAERVKALREAAEVAGVKSRRGKPVSGPHHAGLRDGREQARQIILALIEKEAGQ